MQQHKHLHHFEFICFVLRFPVFFRLPASFPCLAMVTDQPSPRNQHLDLLENPVECEKLPTSIYINMLISAEENVNTDVYSTSTVTLYVKWLNLKSKMTQNMIYDSRCKQQAVYNAMMTNNWIKPFLNGYSWLPILPSFSWRRRGINMYLPAILGLLLIMVKQCH